MARQCYYVDETMNPDGKGFIPALIVEGEPGYMPMGDPASDGVTAPLAYRWGSTIEEARKVTEATNLKTFGLTPEDCTEIVASSFRASFRARS